MTTKMENQMEYEMVTRSLVSVEALAEPRASSNMSYSPNSLKRGEIGRI